MVRYDRAVSVLGRPLPELRATHAQLKTAYPKFFEFDVCGWDRARNCCEVWLAVRLLHERLGHVTVDLATVHAYYEEAKRHIGHSAATVPSEQMIRDTHEYIVGMIGAATPVPDSVINIDVMGQLDVMGQHAIDGISPVNGNNSLSGIGAEAAGITLVPVAEECKQAPPPCRGRSRRVMKSPPPSRAIADVMRSAERHVMEGYRLAKDFHAAMLYFNTAAQGLQTARNLFPNSSGSDSDSDVEWIPNPSL